MGTFVETILGSAAGTIVTVEPDLIVINDGVSHAAVDEISTVAKPESVMVIYDHDVPTGRPEAAAVLRKNLAFAQRYGCTYIQSKGTGYQYLLNEVIRPGQIVIGGGSHGGIFGAAGALGINVSIPELARVTETGRYSVVVPETEYVCMKGTLKEGVSIMDAALWLFQEKERFQGKAIEFYCPTLDAHQKAVLCSMGNLGGAYTAGVTEEDPGRGIAMDLREISPMLMMPCASREIQNLASVCEKEEMRGLTMKAGQIGGYTGGTIEELRKADNLIAGNHMAQGFRLTICPATSRDYIQAVEEGILARMIDYGAQISAAGDHSVVIQGAGVMGPGERLITTGLYTFPGAMGCEDAEVYTGSVESVIAASINKQI